MANCCGNWVEINGNPEQVKKFIELVGEEFDFQKVIPIGESSSEANEKWNCSSIAFDTQYEFRLISFAVIDGTNIDIEDQFLFTLQRIAASADEYGGEALIATVG
ncbi:hypothetical protein LCGC14_2478950, partial [marine sediment metagenome]